MTTLLAGRYEVIEEIARGGMGKVVRAHDRVLDREVAIKLLLGRAGNAALRARFLEESQVTGQLAHPNIVPVYELGVSDGEPFLVMKLVAGRTLRDVVKAIKAGDRKTAREHEGTRLVRLFLKACEAMGYAHGRGVIHRDLKPSNIMVARGDEVLVMDWGLAKPYAGAQARGDLVRSQVRTFRGVPGMASGTLQLSGDMLSAERGGAGETVAEARGPDGTHADGSHGDTSQLTAQGDIVGTPAYMPPEQVDDASRIDPRADVYSMGAVLYELLALRPPYEGGGMEVITTLVRQAPPTPREAAPGREIPPALEAIVLKAMSRDPQERYADCGALAEEVARWLDGRATTAYRETARETIVRLATRHKGMLATAAASLVAVQVALVGGALAVRGEMQAVERDTAAARVAAEEADRGRQEAEVERARADVIARAVAASGRCVRIASELERRARDLVPLGAGDDVAGEHDFTLPELRARARQELGEVRRELEALPASAEDLAPFLAEVEGALRAVDEAYVGALLARAPSRALALLEEAAGEGLLALDPGAQALAKARAHHRLGRLEAARRELERAGESTGAPGRALLALLGGAPLDQVEGLVTEAIRARPATAWLYLRRAEVRAQLGRFDEAAADYDRAASLHRIDAWIYSSKVRRTFPLVSFHNETHLVRFTLELIHELAPENREADAMMPRGGLWAGSSSWQGYKETVVEKAANDDPVRAHRLGAEGALIVERWTDAEVYADRVLARAPQDPVALGCKAEARLEQGDADGAEQLARRALAAAPDEARASTTLGRALMSRGRYADALPHLERGARGVLTSDPWRHLAECCLRLDDPARWEQGVQAARRGLSLDPYAVVYYSPAARPVAGDPRLHRAIARLRVRQGKLGAAIAHHMRAFVIGQNRAAAALGKDFIDALEAGDLHEQLGLYNEALALWGMAQGDEKLAAQAEERSRRLIERFGGPR